MLSLLTPPPIKKKKLLYTYNYDKINCSSGRSAQSGDKKGCICMPPNVTLRGAISAFQMWGFSGINLDFILFIYVRRVYGWKNPQCVQNKSPPLVSHSWAKLCLSFNGIVFIYICISQIYATCLCRHIICIL